MGYLIDYLGDFISRERNRNEGEDNNRFAFSIGQVALYLDFLQLSCGRHDEAMAAAARALDEMRMGKPHGDVTVGPQYLEALTQLNLNSFLVQYEIECFFLFAKILLDKVANFVWDYFGQARNLSLRSHDQLVKNLSKYSRKKEISLPDSFVELASSLKDTVADYRDKQIAHLQSPELLRG